MNKKKVFQNWHYYETGVRHLQEMTACQDRALSAYHPGNDVAAAAVSDGAGSCRFSQYGAEIAVSVAVRMLTERFDELYHMPEEDFVIELVNAIRERFAETAEKIGCEYYELSSTLICAAMAGDGRYLYFHVGDGIIAAVDRNQHCWVISQYEHTIAWNYTTFITSDDLVYQFDKGKNDFTGFFLCSDGPESMLAAADGKPGVRLKLLLEMGHLFPKKRMLEELNDMTAWLKQEGMDDDASYAFIADKRYTGDVLLSMSPQFRHIVLDIPEKKQRRFLMQMKKALEALAAVDGISRKKMARILHIHKEKYTRKRLSHLINAKVISELEGKYYF